MDFLSEIIKNPDFIEGAFDTTFITTNFPDYKKHIDLKKLYESAIAALLWEWKIRDSQRTLFKHLPSGWRSNFYQPHSETYLFNGSQIKLTYKCKGDDLFKIQITDQKYKVELISICEGELTCRINENLQSFIIASNGDNVYVHSYEQGCLEFTNEPTFKAIENNIGEGAYTSPMPGEVIKILVEPGKTIKMGEQLVLINSMKMENAIEAQADGVVEEIFVTEKSFIEADTLLLKIKS